MFFIHKYVNYIYQNKHKGFYVRYDKVSIDSVHQSQIIFWHNCVIKYVPNEKKSVADHLYRLLFKRVFVDIKQKHSCAFFGIVSTHSAGWVTLHDSFATS